MARFGRARSDAKNSAVRRAEGAGAALRGGGAAIQGTRLAGAGTAMIRSGEFLARLPTTDSVALRAQQAIPALRLPDFGTLSRVEVPHHGDTPRIDTPTLDAPRADVPSVEVPSRAVDTPNPGSVADNLVNRTPNLDTPSTPDVDVPAARGTDGLAPQVADGDPTRRPDQTATPTAAREPALVGTGTGDGPPRADTPGTDTAPSPDTRGGDSPSDRTADTTPGDTTPGNGSDVSTGNGGDGTPGDGTPGNGGPGNPYGGIGDSSYDGPVGNLPDGSWVNKEHAVTFRLSPEANHAPTISFTTLPVPSPTSHTRYGT